MPLLENNSEVKVLKWFSVFVCQGIFVLAYLSHRSNFLRIFVQSVIQRSLLNDYLFFIIPLLNRNGLASFTTDVGSCRLSISTDKANICHSEHIH